MPVPVSAYSGILSVFPYRRQSWRLGESQDLPHLSDVEVEELHHQAVEAPVVDVGQAGDEVVLGITEPVHHKSLPLQSSLVVRARLVELESHGGAVKHRDPTVDHTTSALANLEHHKHSDLAEIGREMLHSHWSRSLQIVL